SAQSAHRPQSTTCRSDTYGHSLPCSSLRTMRRSPMRHSPHPSRHRSPRHLDGGRHFRLLISRNGLALPRLSDLTTLSSCRSCSLYLACLSGRVSAERELAAFCAIALCVWAYLSWPRLQ